MDGNAWGTVTLGRPSQTGGQAEGRRAQRVRRAGVGPREH
jgi:hypothetical protein